MRHLALFLALTAACDSPGISEDTVFDDPGTEALDAEGDTDDQGTDADTEADTTTSNPSALTSEDLDNRTYLINYDDVTWVAPQGASVISGQVPVEYILLHVSDVDDTEQSIEAVGGLGITSGSAVIQDPCQDVFGFGEQDFSTNPIFDIGPTTLSFPVQGQNFDINDASIQATFIEDGNAIADISIAGQIDARNLSGLTDLDVCSVIQFLGDTCTACPDGVAQCLDVFLTVDRADADDDLVFDDNIVPGGASCR